MKKLLLIIMLAGISIPAMAQLEIGEFSNEIGGSYQIKDREPTTGFGIKHQLGRALGFTGINAYTRIEGAYFSENKKTYFEGGGGLLAGYPLFNKIEPYIGGTIGMNNAGVAKLTDDHFNSENDEDPEMSFIYSGIAGAKLIFIPFIKPFVEYKLTSAQKDESGDSGFEGRIVVGVAFRF